MISVEPVDSKEYSICYDLIYMLIFALHCLNRQFESICLLELAINLLVAKFGIGFRMLRFGSLRSPVLSSLMFVSCT